VLAGCVWCVLLGCGEESADDAGADPIAPTTTKPTVHDAAPAPAADSTPAPSADELPGLVDPDDLRRHLDSALDRRTLERKQINGKWTQVLPGTTERFDEWSGWAKEVRGDGATRIWRVVNGQENGPFATWYGSGTKWDAGSRLNGKMHGLYRTWDREGHFVKDEIYRNGKRIDP